MILRVCCKVTTVTYRKRLMSRKPIKMSSTMVMYLTREEAKSMPANQSVTVHPQQTKGDDYLYFCAVKFCADRLPYIESDWP